MLEKYTFKYSKFSDEQPSLKAMRSPYLGIQNSWIIVKNCRTEIPIKKGLAWTSTVHEIQGLNLEQTVIDFDVQKQKWENLKNLQ